MSCANGASVKSGLDPNQQILVDRYLWEQVTGSPSSWLDPILEALVPTTIKLSDLCAANLSDPPLPDLVTIAAAFARDPISLASVLSWVRQKLEYSQFATGCVCNAGSGTSNCTQTISGSYTASGNMADWKTLSNFPPLQWATQITDVSFSFSGGNAQVQVLTENAPGGTVTVLNDTGGFVPPGTYNHAFNVTPSAPDNIPSANQTVNGQIAFFTKAQSSAVTVTWSMTVNGQCSQTTTPPTSPTQPTQPPQLTLPPSWACSSTGDLCTRLQQISEKIDWMFSQVNLIQRQIVPFAYVPGVTVSVSGNGSLAVSGILGLSLSLTDTRSGITNFPDNPTTIIDLGWLTTSTSDGNEEALPIRRTNQLFLGISPAVTSVRWALPVGVSGTLKTLLREP